MNCKQGTKFIITQMVDLLDVVGDENYRTHLPIFKGSSIGQHIRHITDFYTCFISGFNEGLIDYSKRERNHLIEMETAFAKGVMGNILDEITYCDEEKIIDVRVDFTSELGVERPIVKSSIGREMMYAYDHAVHHLAMIKMGIRVAFPNIQVDEKVGVAPSTLKHWKGKKASS
ncbi:MAG: hypothetical protein NXI23_15255 [Bacteroidetes bacterium]|jgi:hypothetical protein|nr:hypothetical protein [Bacteroidota bacterium]MDF1867759.1 hypothetical protein [Saprospiraceae bacterium]